MDVQGLNLTPTNLIVGMTQKIYSDLVQKLICDSMCKVQGDGWYSKLVRATMVQLQLCVEIMLHA
jgi:hypothetical protein